MYQLYKCDGFDCFTNRCTLQKIRKLSQNFHKLSCGNHQVKLASTIKVKLKVKLPQPCLTLCKPMDYRVYGILYTRILEYVAFPFSRRSFQPTDQIQVSHDKEILKQTKISKNGTLLDK